MSEEAGIHKGHRQRMLKRYLEHGIDSFEDHELLEIFLFSAYSRRNTNDIAHRLIERFGSLEGVMHADYDALCEVDDVGPTAAGLICFLKDFSGTFVLLERSCPDPMHAMFHEQVMNKHFQHLRHDPFSAEIRT